MFRAAPNVVIVVVQRHVRIGLTRKFECLSQIIRADDLQPSRRAQVLTIRAAGAIADRFIHDVPARHLPFEMTDERMDVIPEPREGQCPVRAFKEPRIQDAI